MSTLNVLYSLLIFSVNITILKYKANKLFTNSFTFYSFIYNYQHNSNKQSKKEKRINFLILIILHKSHYH